MKKIIAFVLIASIITLTLASCGSEPAQETSIETTVSAANEVDNEQQDETTQEDRIVADVPEKNYEGYEFKILVSGNSELSKLRNDFLAEEETGDVINDARYTRNKIVEEKLNVIIKPIELGAGVNIGFDNIKKTVMAGDFAYDAAMVGGYAACKLASSGYLYDLKSLPYLDLDQPWWDQKANVDLTIQGKMYYTTGDISTANNDATYCILFNKKMVQDYGIEDLYSLVKSGKWTIDKFVEIASIIPPDINGTGVFEIENTYGALIWDDTMMGIVNAAGEKCASVNSDGNIELMLYSEKILSMFDKYTEFVFDTTRAHAYQRKNWDGVASNNMFASNKSLFYLQLLSLVTDLRGMVDDFGILPYFKYDEIQKDYYSTVGSWHSVFLSVPLTQEDVERTGIVLESLAAESRYTVKPAYYDIALKGKYARDEESLEMLDIILTTRTYDIGWYYEIGGYNEQIMNLFRNYQRDFTSMYEKYEPKAQRDIEKLNDNFAAVFEN